MYHILVRHPLPSASGRRSRRRKQGQRASAPGPDASPCASSGCQHRRVGRAKQEQRDARQSSSRCSKAGVQRNSRSSDDGVDEANGRSNKMDAGCGAEWDGQVRHRHVGEGHGERTPQWRLPWWSHGCGTMEELAVVACVRQRGKEMSRAFFFFFFEKPC
jgi:hypothetical protein